MIEVSVTNSTRLALFYVSINLSFFLIVITNDS